MMRDWSKPINSEIPGYVGSVSFPWPFMLVHYQAWQKLKSEISAREKDSETGSAKVVYVKRLNHEADEKDTAEQEEATESDETEEEEVPLNREFDFFFMSDWELVTFFVKPSLKVAPDSGYDKNTINAAWNDPSGASTPYDLAVWLVPLVEEYVETQLDPFG